MKPNAIHRRAALALAAAPLLAGICGGALAQAAWPDKMIKLIVPFPAGGPTDTASRIVGQKLAERLKQPVVVENRPGASGSIAAVQVAKSPADGYTLMMLATPTLLAPHLYKKAGYDTVKDFAPVATVYDLPIVIVVNPRLLPDVTDLKGLIAHAKAQKTPINEYKREAFALFERMLVAIREDVTKILAHAQFQFQAPPELPEMPSFITSHIDPLTGDDDSNDFDAASLGLVSTRLPPLQIIQPDPEAEMGEDPAEWEGKVSRNAPCPCGSGQKYKHCHGAF